MKANTRDQIVEMADRLFYEHGYAHTSFADIASEVSISRGNFYHHFKTKDAILDAVIERRMLERADLLERWENAETSPLARILRFIEILFVNQPKIMKSGCPVGTLCGEMAKLDHPARADANAIMDLFRHWLVRQFEALGRTEDADDLAMHVLMLSQGIAVLANTYRDEAFVHREVKRAEQWLRSLVVA